MRRVIRSLARVLILVILASLAVFGILVWQIDRLGRQDGARPADAIVVLGARVDPDGRPGSDLTSRTLHAVDLWQQGYAAQIICSGGIKNEPLSSAAVCRNYAIKLGVPADNVWVADGTANTVEDAAATAAVMRSHGWRSAILVSHPLHLFRARWFFRLDGVDVVTSPTTTDTKRIIWPLRSWYAVREAGAIVITTLDGWGWMPSDLKAQLETWRSSLP